MGFEPTNVGFANRCLRPLGYPAIALLRGEYIPTALGCQVYIFSFVDFFSEKYTDRSIKKTQKRIETISVTRISTSFPPLLTYSIVF